jgi:large subunit ribosomal protein L6
MKIYSKRHVIRIPKDISMLYCDKKMVITFLGPLSNKSLRLKLKIYILKTKSHIFISKLPINTISGNEKKKLKALQGTTIAIIKQIITEISYISSKKLLFVGVGYKAFPIELNKKNQILHFRLGYSHQIYFKVSNNFNVFCHKTITLFISGHSYQKISQISALIRSYKYPEPYKGKGILYVNEKIKIKEGKKV